MGALIKRGFYHSRATGKSDVSFLFHCGLLPTSPPNRLSDRRRRYSFSAGLIDLLSGCCCCCVTWKEITVCLMRLPFSDCYGPCSGRPIHRGYFCYVLLLFLPVPCLGGQTEHQTLSVQAVTWCVNAVCYLGLNTIELLLLTLYKFRQSVSATTAEDSIDSPRYFPFSLVSSWSVNFPAMYLIKFSFPILGLKSPITISVSYLVVSLLTSVNKS